MRKLLLSVFLLGSFAYAGTITHTDYTAGSVITAAGQNSNENIIVNEINGNLNTDNLLDGGVATADLADNAVTYGKLATIVQSTVTLVNNFFLYRKPNIQYISATTVDIEANTGTANETCIQFIDEVRCVTENTGSTSQYRRAIVSDTASMSGTHNSGLLSGETLTANSWLAVYAVKTSDNASKYVLVMSTNAPVQANYSTLNTKLGTGQWVYMGVVRYGDDAAATTSIVRFVQSGPKTLFRNTATSNFTKEIGLILAGTAGVISSTYTYSGSMVGAAAIAPYLTSVDWGIYTQSDTQPSRAQSADGTVVYLEWVGVSGGVTRYYVREADPTLGIATAGASNLTRELVLVGYIDPIVLAPAPRL